MSSSLHPARLRHFVQGMTRAVEADGGNEAALLERGQVLMLDLITHDDWLPEAFAQPNPAKYQQYLLYCDPFERFSLASFIWAPGQTTPVHDHTVWGLIGMLRGQETAQAFGFDAAGRLVAQGQPETLLPGQMAAVSPTLGDIHQVSNTLAGGTSISIHVYGGNIGAVRRWVYAEDGSRKPFVSGYSNTWLPNLWDRSKDSA